MEDGQKAAEQIRQQFADAVVSAGSYRGQHWVEVRPGSLVEICTALRDDPAASFDFLVDVTAVHYPEDEQPMEAVYHLYSYSRNDRLRLKVRTGNLGPLPTLVGVWKAADWNEREVYDMFGIRFEGHPDLRRILMPDDYTDFPLRKELPLFRA